MGLSKQMQHASSVHTGQEDAAAASKEFIAAALFS